MPTQFTMSGQREIDVGLGFKLYPGGFVGSGSALEVSDLRDGTVRSAAAAAVNTGDMQAAFERATLFLCSCVA